MEWMEYEHTVHGNLLVVESINIPWIQETIETGWFVRIVGRNEDTSDIQDIYSVLETIGNHVHGVTVFHDLHVHFIYRRRHEITFKFDHVHTNHHIGIFVGMDGDTGSTLDRILLRWYHVLFKFTWIDSE